MSNTPVFDIKRVKELLPHRYPFLMIDKVIKLDLVEGSSRQGQTAVAIKNVTVNEEHFNGHFPSGPIMPGVLIIEAMAQAGGIACYKENSPALNLIIASVRGARFRKPVVPGDQLVLTGTVAKDRGKMVVISSQAHVDDQLVAECELVASVVPID